MDGHTHQRTRHLAALLPTVAQLFRHGREKHVLCSRGRVLWVVDFRGENPSGFSRRLSRARTDRPKHPRKLTTLGGGGGVSLPLFLRWEFKQDSSGTGRADPLWANAPKLGRPSGLRRYDIIHEKLNRHRAYRERERKRERVLYSNTVSPSTTHHLDSLLALYTGCSLICDNNFHQAPDPLLGND